MVYQGAVLFIGTIDVSIDIGHLDGHADISN